MQKNFLINNADIMHDVLQGVAQITIKLMFNGLKNIKSKKGKITSIRNVTKC
jgi:hypothetical protein